MTVAAQGDGVSYLGIAFAREKRYQEALEHFLEAKARNARDVEVRHNLGLLYADTGRSDLAVPELEAAIALNPGSPKLHAALASVLDLRGTAMRRSVIIARPFVSRETTEFTG